MFNKTFLEIYADLLESLYKDPRITWPTEGLCAFSALTGKHWTDSPRVAFYGRALNGWVPSGKFQWEDAASPETRLKRASDICEAGYNTSICKLDERLLVGPCDYDDPQLHWVHHQRKRTFYSRYRVDTTPFWSVVGLVLQGLTAPQDRPNGLEKHWASWAAWSNGSSSSARSSLSMTFAGESPSSQGRWSWQGAKEFASSWHCARRLSSTLN
jgi:hypothetical protein